MKLYAFQYVNKMSERQRRRTNSQQRPLDSKGRQIRILASSSFGGLPTLGEDDLLESGLCKYLLPEQYEKLGSSSEALEKKSYSSRPEYKEREAMELQDRSSSKQKTKKSRYS